MYDDEVKRRKMDKEETDQHVKCMDAYFACDKSYKECMAEYETCLQDMKNFWCVYIQDYFIDWKSKIIASIN